MQQILHHGEVTLLGLAYRQFAQVVAQHKFGVALQHVLATRFGIEIDVVPVYTRDDGYDHDRFDIRIVGPLAHAA